MSTRGRWGVAGAIGLTLVIVYALTRGPAPMTAADPPDAFSFAVLGDAPYYLWEELQFRIVRQDLDAHELSWVLHVGDIFWRPCSDAMYRRHLDWFDGLRHPVIYTPGDNEWADCWEPGSGAHAPLERLDRLRQLFFDDPATSRGARPRSLVSQASDLSFAEFVENARWTHAGLLFATVHLVGSRNAMEVFPDRTASDDAAARRRTDAAAAWVREAFAEAATRDASAVVLGFHGDPGFAASVGDPYRQAFEPFLAVLEQEVERFGGPVLLLHGDHHEYTVDQPLVRRTTGRRLSNLTRLRVPGSPEVGWVRVVVRPGARPPFAFEPRVIPRWKYW